MENLRREAAKILGSKEDFLLEHEAVPAAEAFYKDILHLLFPLFRKKNISSNRLLLQAINSLSIYAVLLKEKRKMTTRELFYRAKEAFISQKKVSSSLQGILSRTKIPEEALQVIPSLKGTIYGECSFILKGQKEPPHRIKGVSLILQMDEVEEVICLSEILLVVEKEAVFTSICPEIERIEESLGKRVLLVTGKGYPCRNTLKSLMRIKESKIFGLFDCDPYGIDIYNVYRNGSKKHPELKIPSLRRIGVSLKEAEDSLLPISSSPEIQILLRLSSIYDLSANPSDISSLAPSRTFSICCKQEKSINRRHPQGTSSLSLLIHENKRRPFIHRKQNPTSSTHPMNACWR